MPSILEPFVNDYKIHVFEVAWLSDKQIECMTSDFKAVAQFFKDKRLGIHNMIRNTFKLRHKDEILKLLSVFTKDLRYEKVMQSENYERMNTMCEIWDWVANEGRNEIITLWNWLQDSGRGNEAVEMMNPANESLRKTLFAEYEFSTQKKQ